MKKAGKANQLFRRVFVHVVIGAMLFAIGVYVGKTRGVPFVNKQDFVWSIGIYTGDSPIKLHPLDNDRNPVISARDVTDVPADFVADPFMVREKSDWYLFFEVLNRGTRKGDIGFASSKDGLKWHYKQIILNEPFHLSYPYVFKWKDDYYMIPESHIENSIRLYKSINFPTKWSFERALISGRPFRDNAILYFDNKWWLFTTTSGNHDNLLLYYSDDLFGPWHEHPKSPIVKHDPRIGRLGGRVIVYNGKMFRYAQDCSQGYGHQVIALQIDTLTTKDYVEHEIGTVLTASGAGWNKKGMHTVDPHQLDDGKWIAAVDGYKESVVLGLKF